MYTCMNFLDTYSICSYKRKALNETRECFPCIYEHV